MPVGWRKTIHALLGNIRDLALTILVIGGAQVLLALLIWPALFRSFEHPQGFSMALSLVGFASWLVSFFLSFGARRGMAPSRAPPLQPASHVPPLARSTTEKLQAQLERSGCGFVLFLSSLIPLGLAFVLRVQADLRTGKTWSDIFPTMP